jgi:hypothetical protein
MNRFGSNSFDNENDQFAQNQQVGRQLGENSPRAWNEQNRPHGSHPNYRPDAVNDIRYVNRNVNPNQNRNEWGGRGGENPNMPYYSGDDSYRHHDTNIWTERNDYKDQDYRYRSGHRNYWHEDYDQQYEGRPHRPHPRDFFTNIGQGIREGWENLTHRHHRDDIHHDDSNRRGKPHNAYENYRLANSPRRDNPQSNQWHNSGPDHRDEDFFNSRNFRP